MTGHFYLEVILFPVGEKDKLTIVHYKHQS